jgi:hypothetical protein
VVGVWVGDLFGGLEGDAVEYEVDKVVEEEVDNVLEDVLEVILEEVEVLLKVDEELDPGDGHFGAK